MNFSEDEKNILGQELIYSVSNSLPLIDQEHVRIDLPFPIDDILQFESIELVQKLKIKMVRDAISIFLKYPLLHSIGIFKNIKNYHASICQIVWDSPISILKSEEYKKSKLNLYAFSHNFFNGKRHIKFIRDIHNNMVSHDDINVELKETFSYLAEGKNSDLLAKDLKKNDLESATYFEVVNWYGGKVITFPKNMENFIGKDFVSELNYIKMNEYLTQKNNNVTKANKI